MRTAKARVGLEGAIKCRSRATCGDGGHVQIGDAASVLVTAAAGLQTVNVARGKNTSRLDTQPAYFLIVAFFTTRAGTTPTIVHPFVIATDKMHFCADNYSCMFLSMQDVRRALAWHYCQCRDLFDSAAGKPAAVTLGASNKWAIFGRAAGYPSRSG